MVGELPAKADGISCGTSIAEKRVLTVRAGWPVVNRFVRRLAGGQLSEADAVELEDGRAEDSKQQNGDDHFREVAASRWEDRSLIVILILMKTRAKHVGFAYLRDEDLLLRILHNISHL